MKKIILLALFACFIMSPGQVNAQFNPACPSVYGAKCPTGNLFIDKKVRNPQSGEFIESLSSNGPTFLPGQEVQFRIEVRNNGNAELQGIQVQDRLPDFVEFVSGPGNFSNRTLSWTIDRLGAGEFRLFDVKVRINGKGIADGITCLTNFSSAQKDQMSAQDSSVFCVQTKVLGVTSELPRTGPAQTGLVLLASVGMLGASGFFYRKLRRVK